MVEEIVILDIDGTPADVSERLHHIKKKPKDWDWDAFFLGIPQDKTIHSIVRLCNILYTSGIKILLCTGRGEQDRTETVKWLAQQGVNYHELIFRRDGNRRSDVIIKREMLAGIDRSKILFVVEDRGWGGRDVVFGGFSLQCAPREF